MKKRKLKIRTAKGTKVKIERGKPRQPCCGNCGQILKGTINVKTYRQGTIARTKKRPERKYGGVLCSRCSRQKIKDEVRKCLK
ncbi:MAG: 50S ribosomal protein L34e [Candidatus Nanoarchaeia archaeon]|nr:50S ribosomal protein L34e [Candidatus Nanoarchaeia archaeon]